MRTIYLVNGELGGTGKTTYTSVFYEYRMAEDSIELIDTDRSNPNVGLRYLPEEYEKGASIFFSDHQDEYAIADEIFERATKVKGDVLVNLPAQVASILDNWIQRNQLFEMAAEHGIRFVNWYLTNGSFHSIRLFKSFVEKYQDNMVHVLVKNHGLCSNWEHLSADVDLDKLKDRYKIKHLDFPALDPAIMYSLDRCKLSFDEGLNSSSIKIMEKQRIKIFLKKAFTNIGDLLEKLDSELLEAQAKEENKQAENKTLTATEPKQFNSANNSDPKDNEQVRQTINNPVVKENQINSQDRVEAKELPNPNELANDTNTQFNGNGKNSNNLLPRENNPDNSSNGSSNGQGQIDNRSQNGIQATFGQTSEYPEATSNSEVSQQVDPNHVFDPNDLEDNSSDSNNNSSHSEYLTADPNNNSHVSTEKTPIEF